MTFKKIVSNLSFSPSLIGQLSAYEKKIKNEEITRRVGLLFLVLTIIVQCFIVLRPPESSNSLSLSDMADRGYDTGSKNCSNKKLAYCIDNLTLSNNAINLSQGNIPASNTTQKPGDYINITIEIANNSKDKVSTIPIVNLADTLEYSEVIDNSGGRLDEYTNSLFWEELVINSNSSITKTYTIKIMDEIPPTAKGLNHTASYDCIIDNQFGNKVDMPIECPLVKNIEHLSSAMSLYNNNFIIYIHFVVLLIAILLYIRTRQIRREIKLIRHASNKGSI